MDAWWMTTCYWEATGQYEVKGSAVSALYEQNIEII